MLTIYEQFFTCSKNINHNLLYTVTTCRSRTSCQSATNSKWRAYNCCWRSCHSLVGVSSRPWRTINVINVIQSCSQFQLKWTNQWQIVIFSDPKPQAMYFVLNVAIFKVSVFSKTKRKKKKKKPSSSKDCASSFSIYVLRGNFLGSLSLSKLSDFPSNFTEATFYWTCDYMF